MTEIVFKEESYLIVGACFEVYNEMGCGFLEAVYQECLSIELAKRRIPFVSHQQIKLQYKTQQLQTTYRPDFICYERIIVELKAARFLVDVDRAQVHNYLKSTKTKLGLLVNFGHFPKIQLERIVR